MKQILNEIFGISNKVLEDARQILEITKEMKKQIQSEEIDGLHQSISLRQQFIDQADNNIAILNQLIHQYDNPHNEEILNYQNQKKEIYQAIYELEKQNQMQGEKLLKSYKEKIKGIHHGKKAMNAYGKRPINQPIMLNKVK